MTTIELLRKHIEKKTYSEISEEVRARLLAQAQAHDAYEESLVRIKLRQQRA